MIAHSMLFKEANGVAKAESNSEMPTFFPDLNLDQIVDVITAGKDEYDLRPFFYTALHDVDAVHYRHEVLQDLENAVVFEPVKSFANKMRSIRDHLAQADKLHFKYQKEAWILDAMEIKAGHPERCMSIRGWRLGRDDPRAADTSLEGGIIRSPRTIDDVDRSGRRSIRSPGAAHHTRRNALLCRTRSPQERQRRCLRGRLARKWNFRHAARAESQRQANLISNSLFFSSEIA